MMETASHRNPDSPVLSHGQHASSMNTEFSERALIDLTLALRYRISKQLLAAPVLTRSVCRCRVFDASVGELSSELTIENRRVWHRRNSKNQTVDRD